MWGLQELPFPEPVSWLAWTPATSAFLALAALALAWWGWRRVRAWRGAAYRRDALARLRALERAPGGLAEVPSLLRATALSAFPRDEIASLRGEAWKGFLNRTGGGFDDEAGAWLDRLPYQPDAADAVPADVAARLIHASRRWIRIHRAEP